MWKKGESGNPKGRPPGALAFIDRANKFLENYTVDEILDLSKDKDAIKKLPTIDYMILMRITEALKHGGGLSMDRLLDRTLGKPKTILVHQGADDAPPINLNVNPTTPEEAARLYAAALAKS